MEGIRVLLGNEPLAYRDVLRAAVAMLRPGVELSVVDPADLDGAVGRWRPHLVVCSRCGGAPCGPLAWVVLYPAGQTAAMVCVDGEEMALPDLELDQLMALIDRTTLLARLAGAARPERATPGAG